MIILVMLDFEFWVPKSFYLYHDSKKEKKIFIWIGLGFGFCINIGGKVIIYLS